MQKTKSKFTAKIEVVSPSIIKQVITNIRHPLDLIREQISNMCAPEVRAKNIKIKYIDNLGKFGASFIFSDDGCGMDYAGDENGKLDFNGRLDRFLALGASGIIGLPSDFFGWKGLGSKLAINCKQLIVRTKTKSGENYRVIFDDPRGKLLEKNEIPEGTIERVNEELSHKPTSGTGTHIIVAGYNGGEDEFSKYEIIDYLYQWTLIGCTKDMKELQLPRFIFDYNDDITEIKPGYKFITEDLKDGLKESDRWSTIIIKQPFKKEKILDNGKKITVILKGGFSHHLSGFGLPKGTGLVLSVKGIPYFSLKIRDYASDTTLDVNPKNCRFVAECDEFAEYDTLDMARSTYKRNSIGRAFEEIIVNAFEEFCGSRDYKGYEEQWEDQKIKRLGDELQNRIEVINSPQQEFVFIKGSDEPIHRVPENERDVLALLWKLEGMNNLPFHYFKSLEHANREGIDLLIKIRETRKGEMKQCAAEVKKVFNPRDYTHEPSQASIIFCWKVASSAKLRESKELSFKKFARLGETEIWVYVISEFDILESSTRVDKNLK